MGIGWQENHTATGARKERLRSRGRAGNRSDCIACQNQRRMIEIFEGATGKKYMVWVVCRFCEEE